jgi:hypothetical protein
VPYGKKGILLEKYLFLPIVAKYRIVEETAL